MPLTVRTLVEVREEEGDTLTVWEMVSMCVGHRTILNRWGLGLPFTKSEENHFSALKLL